MPYEIPQKLQYEEKIVFNLTFKQMIYLLIFGFPALIIFLKTSLNIVAKAIVGVVLLGTAAMFMFFEFSSKIADFLSWFKFREVWLMDKKMKDFLGIEKVEEGVFYVQK
jgi:hypothetical protein